jgi:hypothetical protein
MVKMTFTLDAHTAETLRRTASRLKKPQSAVIREAVQDYASKADRLTDQERNRMLETLDRALARSPGRSQAEVDKEIAGIRATRRAGGRKSRPK